MSVTLSLYVLPKNTREALKRILLQSALPRSELWTASPSAFMQFTGTAGVDTTRRHRAS